MRTSCIVTANRSWATSDVRRDICSSDIRSSKPKPRTSRATPPSGATRSTDRTRSGHSAKLPTVSNGPAGRARVTAPTWIPTIASPSTVPCHSRRPVAWATNAALT